MSSLAQSAAIRPRPPHPAPPAGVDPDTALLQLAGEVRGEHALLIGPHALELMCALIRRGAAEVSLLRQGVRAVRATGAGDRTLVTGVLPWFGPLASA